MAGRPRTRAREIEVVNAARGEGLARGLTAQTRQEAHAEREQVSAPRVTIEGTKRSREEIREEALEKMYPVAEQVIADALLGGEVSSAQLNAAFRIFEQQLGKPKTVGEAVDANEPVKIIYEAAVFAPTEWVEQQHRLAALKLGPAKLKLDG